MEENDIPLVLNEEGRKRWKEEHSFIKLPEFVVTRTKPLTDFEERDKNNAVRLGLIENSDKAYRNWQNRIHWANQRDKAIGTAGAGASMLLASLLAAAANPTAGNIAFGTMGVTNLPNQVDKIK